MEKKRNLDGFLRSLGKDTILETKPSPSDATFSRPYLENSRELGVILKYANSCKEYAEHLRGESFQIIGAHIGVGQAAARDIANIFEKYGANVEIIALPKSKREYLVDGSPAYPDNIAELRFEEPNQASIIKSLEEDAQRYYIESMVDTYQNMLKTESQLTKDTWNFKSMHDSKTHYKNPQVNSKVSYRNKKC